MTAPGSLLPKLRLLAASALAGTALTGATLGHAVHGHDPRWVGAAVGLLLGIVAWRRGTFDV